MELYLHSVCTLHDLLLCFSDNLTLSICRHASRKLVGKLISLLDGLEITHSSWNAIVGHRLQYSLPLDPILSRINKPSLFFSLNLFTIILLSNRWYYKMCLPLRFTYSNCVFISPMRSLPHPSNSPWFHKLSTVDVCKL